MRAWRMLAAAVPLCMVLVVGCSGGARDGATAGSSTGSSVVAQSAGTAGSVGVGPRVKVTVPSLGGVAPSATAAESSAGTPGAATAVAGASVAAASVAGTSEPAPVSSAPATVPVELVGCGDCQVLATHANVVGTYAAALITSGGRANLLSLDPTGAVVGIVNVLYGTTFAAPADGQLACGAGGRCVVVAAQPDGKAILSAYQLTDDGGWLDLSGSSGFVSATARGLPVLLEDAYGAAIQVSDGTTTVWTVLGWNGTRFASIGCAPDGAAPDLTQLDPARCLS